MNRNGQIKPTAFVKWADLIAARKWLITSVVAASPVLYWAGGKALGYATEYLAIRDAKIAAVESGVGEVREQVKAVDANQRTNRTTIDLMRDSQKDFAADTRRRLERMEDKLDRALEHRGEGSPAIGPERVASKTETQ